MTDLTEAQKRALGWLQRHNGEGSIDRYGKMVAAGERADFDAATWLRLVTLGRLEPAGKHRLRIVDL